MNKTLRIVLLSIGLTVLTGYMLWAVFFAPDLKKEQVCSNVSVVIEDSLSRRFLTAAEVRQVIRKAGLDPVGLTTQEVDVQKIETCVDSIGVVRKSECYFLQNGELRIRVEQRLPKLRVINEENYYVDSDRRIMPATSQTACHVPVVTGRVSKRMATEEIFDFVDWLEDNDFWNAQVEQINVRVNHDVELVPRVGGHIILLGQLDNYPAKLRKLKVLYTDGFTKIGWCDYRELDLRYQNQVIGRR